MNTRRLETFLAILRCGSFTAAAASLNATQSAVSLRISELEAELGVTLFDRSRRRTVLTAHGHDLVPHAKAVMLAVSEMKAELGDTPALSGTIRVGVAELIAATWLPDLVRSLADTYPRLTLRIAVGTTGELLDLLRDGRLDLALAPGVEADAKVQRLSLGRVEFRWFASGRSATYRLADWSNGGPPILLLESGSFIHSLADEWFREAGLSPSRIDTCNSMSVLASLTAADIGISLLPSVYYRPEIERGELSFVETAADSLWGEFFAVMPRRNPALRAKVTADMAVRASSFSNQHADMRW